MNKLCKNNWLLHQIGQRYRPGEISELREMGDVVTLRLRTGQLFLVRLDRNGELLLEELEVVC